MKIETKNAGDRRVLDTAEGQRMAQPDNLALWRQWGPYLSERQWGTVREDYSADGSAWEYFPHDHARSRAYRWGEDGLGGFADDKLQLCLGLALWNGKDAILKERMFGLTNSQGNHGEDVKELYYYLDGLPTHSYMKMLYKYPQASFPYEALIAENASRGLNEPEFELIDTGVFDENRYFDVQIEYAKAAPNDIIQQITITNRGPETARLHVLPQLWFRNIWSWNGIDAMPHLAAKGQNRIIAEHPGLASMRWVCEEANTLLFCDNDTNEDRLYGRGSSRYFKDGINEFVVHGRIDAVNPNCTGTKAAAHYVLDIPAGGTWIINTRLQPAIKPEGTAASCTVMSDRRAEADAFYAVVQTNIEDADCRLVQRQAFAGMMWCKQYYGYDVRRWLKGDALQPPPPDARGSGRNSDWTHFALGDAEPDNACDIISMPDSWEYPWFAAWDLAFQCITIARIDPGFAKAQLTLLTQSRSQNPNGQIPAFEWDFSNVNPPVHAWAALRIYQLDRKMSGVADYVFLERLFHKLMLNFTWWVNREDAEGRNIFHGGFLGLDNIGLFDLRDPLPGGGRLDQCDGTAWASAYSLSMMRIALELAVHNKVYEDLATKFFEHFIYIAEAIHANGDKGPTGLWDEEDQFYYDVLRIPGQSPQI